MPVSSKYFFLMFLLSNIVFAESSIERLEQQIESLQLQINSLQTSLETMKQELTKAHTVKPLPSEEIEFLQQQVDNLVKSSEGITVNAYATLEYENFSNQKSSFDARNVELLVEGKLSPRLHGLMEIEFERTAKTSGGPRSGEVEVEQGWLQYDVSPALGFRGGVILVPFGRYNLEHFDIVRDLTDRPIVLRRVVPVTWAEAGFGLIGTYELSSGIELAYQAYFMNGLTDVITDKGLRDARGAFGRDNNNNKAFAGRLGVLFRKVELGLSLYDGAYDNAGNGVEGINIDWSIPSGRWELLGELTHFNIDRGLNDRGVLVPRRLEGAYVQLNYDFWPAILDHTFLGRDFASPSLTVALRYDQADNDDDGDIGEGDNKEKRWTLGLNYRPVESYVIKCEYQWNDTTNEVLERGDDDGLICSMSAAF